MPALELTNARFNPLYQNGKIYKAIFQNTDLVYIVEIQMVASIVVVSS